jgi:hypothetical protein
MDIKNPRRILAVGAPGSGVLSVLKGTLFSNPTIIINHRD